MSVAQAGSDSEAELCGRRFGDFVLRERIGEGGFAAVYRCEQPLLGREAVIKVLHQRLRTSDVVLQRFEREARLASRLDHPYAAHVYAFGVEQEDGLAWIAMEMVHGTSLERWLTTRGPLSIDMFVSFFEQVAEVVQNAHDHGIVHRDLKPSNVMMIERAGRVFPKLLDFGIAKLLDDAALSGLTRSFDELESPRDLALDPSLFPSMNDSGGNLTQANATLGSPPYMSPEQWRDPLSVGPRSDLYSLAVMAYEALTGRQPFDGPTIAAIAEQHCFAPVPPVGDQHPAELDRVFQRALAKEPADRPASALAFAGELRAAVGRLYTTDPAFKALALSGQILLPAAAAISAPVAVSATPSASVAATAPTEVDVATATTAVAMPAVEPSKRRRWPIAAGGAALLAGGVAAYLVTAGPSGSDAAPRSPAPVTEAPVAAAPIPAPIPPPAPAPAPAMTAPPAPAMVAVKIQSTPPGADVYRLPSETKVGVTPWAAELPSEAGMQVFVVKKSGYADRRVEVDLRGGGTQTVKLARVSRRAAPASTVAAPPSGAGQVRRKGEPVDPFRTKP